MRNHLSFFLSRPYEMKVLVLETDLLALFLDGFAAGAAR